MSSAPCEVCHGARLKRGHLAVQVKGIAIGEFTRLDLSRALALVKSWSLTERESAIAVRIVEEIRDRLEFLCNVGLDYLSLQRSAATLSGGESQRIRLATQIGTKLRGVLYVLDEPSIGLHPRDNERLLETLSHLRDLGNTVLIVEHDEDTIDRADYVVDLGPGAGRLGGELVAEGTPEVIRKSKKSLTGQYLCGKRSIAVPSFRRIDLSVSRLVPFPQQRLLVLFAAANNLLDRKNVYDYRYDASYSSRTPVRSQFKRSIYLGASFTY